MKAKIRKQLAKSIQNRPSNLRYHKENSLDDLVAMANIVNRKKRKKSKKESSWTFLTNHSHVLLCLAKDSSMRIRDLALEVGITERAVQRILAELVDEGFLDKLKEGRRNIYKLKTDKPLKHPVEGHKSVKDLISLIFD